MFKVIELCNRTPAIVIRNTKDDSFLHSDGNSYDDCPEWWPTRELAQAVLDKYQPPHVWKHGDVFKREGPINFGTFMYVCESRGEPRVVRLHSDTTVYPPIQCYLDGATFLFNIRDKVDQP